MAETRSVQESSIAFSIAEIICKQPAVALDHAEAAFTVDSLLLKAGTNWQMISTFVPDSTICFPVPLTPKVKERTVNDRATRVMNFRPNWANTLQDCF